MKYKVIRDFVDLDDRHHLYHAGDEYPRKGYEPAEKRVKSLLSGNNLAGAVFLAALATEKAPDTDVKQETDEKPKRKPGRPKKEAE